jgi:hypothetical protein
MADWLWIRIMHLSGGTCLPQTVVSVSYFSDMIKVYVECKEGIAMKYTKVRNSHKNSLIKYICYNFQLADNTGVSY